MGAAYIHGPMDHVRWTTFHHSMARPQVAVGEEECIKIIGEKIGRKDTTRAIKT
jgi:hypothetical protein